MNNKILISFVVPVYNVPEKYLILCINSLLEQTQKNIEIIIVNDGSTDNCPKIIDEYGLVDNRIKIIHKKNEGLSAARNTGVKKAKGIYISFVDGDDYVERNFSETLLKNSDNYTMDIVIGKVIKDYESHVSEYKYKLKSNYVYDKRYRKYFQNMVLDFYGNISGVYGKLIKRDLLITKNIFHDEQLSKGAEGIVFNFELFGTINSVIFIEENLYHYMYNEESISAKPNLETNNLVIKCFEKIKREIENDSELLNKMYERLIFVVITTAISGIFHPNQKLRYQEKKKALNNFLKEPLIYQTIKRKNLSKIDINRKVTFYIIVNKLYLFIDILAKIRFKQRSANK